MESCLDSSLGFPTISPQNLHFDAKTLIGVLQLGQVLIFSSIGASLLILALPNNPDNSVLPFIS
jgi:hypothetical protein